MRILVTFAVEAEFAPWLALRKFQERALVPDHWSGGLKVYEAECGRNTLWVLLTGIGAGVRKGLFPIGICARQAGVDVLISSGLAGSLKKELGVGEVIVPRRVGTLRDAAGLEAHAGLMQIAAFTGSKLVDVLLTADHIVETSEEKNRLAFWGDAVDMESQAIMSEFLGEGIPSLTIRAISDANDEDLPLDFNACLTTEGKVKPVPLLKRLLSRPAKTMDVIRFGVRSKRAARNLARFLDSYVLALTPEAIKNDIGVAAE
ncbi:MAG TPA: hypothetical protein VJN89_06920 [Candidatus Acidoferrum sp.]|nr:hypothetical protein [Candidatus Acidoferrum sp.]